MPPKHLSSGGIALRPARSSDALFLYDLRNESAVRKSALSNRVFSLREHRAWLRGKLASPDCRVYIATKGRRRVGQIRFDVDAAGIAEADVALIVETRGRGYGADLIHEGCSSLFAEPHVRACVAHVKLKNEASHRAFERAGFHEVGVKRMKGQTVHEMRLHRSR